MPLLLVKLPSPLHKDYAKLLLVVLIDLSPCSSFLLPCLTMATLTFWHFVCPYLNDMSVGLLGGLLLLNSHRYLDCREPSWEEPVHPNNRVTICYNKWSYILWYKCQWQMVPLCSGGELLVNDKDTVHRCCRGSLWGTGVGSSGSVIIAWCEQSWYLRSKFAWLGYTARCIHDKSAVQW